MRTSAVAPLAVLLACAALFAAGCGGGSGSNGSSTAPAGGAKDGGGAKAVPGGEVESDAPKKATAPNAPAGAKVVSCKVAGGATVGLRATAIDCGTARATMRHWTRERSCTMAKGASRGSCSLGGFRCQTVRSGRGVAVSCARPGADVAFIAKAWPVKKSGAG
jgi:hypothetical protein